MHRHGGERAAARRPRRPLRRLRDAARRARRHPVPARRRRLRLPRGGPRAHARGARSRRSRRRHAVRDGHPPRGAAQRDDAPDAVPRRPARRPPRARSARARAAAPRTGSTIPAGPLRDGRRRRRLRVRQRAPAPRGRRARLPDRAPAGDERDLDALREGGGYERREWWSDEGWAWKEEYDITHPEGWTADGPPSDDRPVLHVSWFEADAFARSHGARLPTEAEWEKAATWTQEPNCRTPATSGSGRRRTSTAIPASPHTPIASTPRCSSATATASCAAPRGRPPSALRSPTFRNWDLPQRRQIFAGVRLAKDVT